MKQEPRIGHFLDEEEALIVEAINKEDYAVGASGLTPERLQSLRAAARNTMNEESTHIPKSDLSRHRAKAMQDGIPTRIKIGSMEPNAIKLAAGRLSWSVKLSACAGAECTNEFGRALARPPIW